MLGKLWNPHHCKFKQRNKKKNQRYQKNFKKSIDVKSIDKSVSSFGSEIEALEIYSGSAFSIRIQIHIQIIQHFILPDLWSCSRLSHTAVI